MILNLGRYINLTEVGRGAQGVVYKGYDTVIERIVAAKTANNLREAKNLGKLHHPNITMIYDVEKYDDTHFIFMEYINGVTLKNIIAEHTRLPLKEKIKIIILIARALHYAHQNGIIHKDIKPANIMIIDDSQIKIMDFGIADTESKNAENSKTYLTGTPHYMSPEQLFGQPLNRQTDIYSLSVLAYELFTGRKPFFAESLQALFKTVLMETPTPLYEINNDIPHEVSRIVIHGLERNKEDRYTSASELADDLELFLHSLEKEECADLPELTDQDMKDLIISLKENYTFFCDFTPNEIMQIMNMSNIVTYAIGDVIFKEGTVGQKMYILISGKVIISKNVADKEETIATLGQGACFGEMAILDQSLRSATAAAQTHCTTIEINEVVLRKTSESLCFKLYRNLSSVISERLRDVNTKYAEMEALLRRTKTRQINCAAATSLVDMGSFQHMIPVYVKKEDIEIHVLPVTSGLALELGKRGSVDIVFAALTNEELNNMDKCFVNVHQLNQNRLMLVGHYSNPAKLSSKTTHQEALRIIAQHGDCLFISRGDNSGVHLQEMTLWKELDIDPAGKSWYVETRQTMSDTLKLTEALKAYTITDQVTFEYLNSTENLKLEIFIDSNSVIDYYYYVMAVNPLIYPSVNYRDTFEFIKWLTSDEGKSVCSELNTSTPQQQPTEVSTAEPVEAGIELVDDSIELISVDTQDSTNPNNSMESHNGNGDIPDTIDTPGNGETPTLLDVPVDF
ncbi:MAG: protein kinase [Nitrospirae bacterium]|nr:protein kinase [Nitrospirota bacterium]